MPAAGQDPAAERLFREAERLASGLEADFGDEAQSPDPEFEALKFFSVPEKSVCG